MEAMEIKEADLYSDIKERTGGEVYLGIVGPVRTGKSTFIKRFMQQLVLPGIQNEEEKNRAVDEIPQSAAGKTIMTTEPKFVPKEAAELALDEHTKVKIRLIDCVGYLVEGATGHMEEDQERKVKTPWQEEEIPFREAARIGTEKVIRDHSTVGIVVMTDGSFGEIPVENYAAAEETTVEELKQLHKPFLILLNTSKPYSVETEEYRKMLETKYAARVLTVNCEQLRKEDIHRIMEEILYEFPISQINFYLPKWTMLLQPNHPIKESLVSQIKEHMKEYHKIRDLKLKPFLLEGNYLKDVHMDEIRMHDGGVNISVSLEEKFYYDFLTEMTGEEIMNEYQLLEKLKEAAVLKKECERTQSAFKEACQGGYGVVTPRREEIHLSAPEKIHQGNKYGVKIHASSPSIHMIRANIETEIAPIVGTESQAEDLIRFLNDSGMESDGIWQTNIFGKNVEQLVFDGINAKIKSIGNESQEKLQNSMEKIVNDSNGGMVCIII